MTMTMSPHMYWRSIGRRALRSALLSILLACGCVGEIARADSSRAASCNAALPDIFARVSPAVVSISATSINPYRLSERVSHVGGSGVLVDASGLILTNSHVAFGRQSITVTLDDGRRLSATLVGADPIFDLAVLRIAKPSSGTLPTVRLGDSDRIRVGDDVFAIGNPLGLDQTLTRGIVSGMNRNRRSPCRSRSSRRTRPSIPATPGGRSSTVAGRSSASTPP
jgi:S1-C subfamily serine protease